MNVTTRAPEAIRPASNGFVRGEGLFLDDVEIPGVLHCHFARSVLAHGELREVRAEAAALAHGVYAVYSGRDLGLIEIPADLRHGPPAPHMSRPVLAVDRVRFAGEPIAAVVAESALLAADAVELIEIHLEELPAVVDPDVAADDEVILFRDAGSNIVSETSMPGFATSHFDVVSSVEVHNQKLAPLAMEPIGIAAIPTNGGLHIWTSHQAPHRLRSQLASLLDIDVSRIRISIPNVGGGFGAKGMFYPEYLVVAAAALRLGKPVKWMSSRREELTAGIHGRGQIHRVTLYGDSDGRVRRASFDMVADVGAYPYNGSMIPGFTRFMASGPYSIDEIGVTTKVVVTNTAPVGTYRGAGRPEATYAIERAMEAFALAAGLDPIEVRRRNLVGEHQFPYETPTGARYDSGRYEAALDLAIGEANISSVRREQSRRRGTDKGQLGVGIAFYLERAGGPITEGEYASVEIGAHGALIVRVGAVDTGQGHDTLWKRIAGRPFNIDSDAIDVLSGDTALVENGVGTFASRSTQVCGSVVHRCSTRLQATARDVAASLLEAAPDDVVVRDGRFGVIGSGRFDIDLKSVFENAALDGISLIEEETWIPGAHTYPYGVHVAVVEVDVDTGDVRLLRALGVDDCGIVIDSRGAVGQVHGSIAQGIGQARYEAVRYSNDGQPLTSTLVDYIAPRAPDLPLYETLQISTPAPSNPLGAKGIGESGCIGFPPAMVSATIDALRHLGVVDLQMPLTPDAVWFAIQRARDLSTQSTL